MFLRSHRLSSLFHSFFFVLLWLSYFEIPVTDSIFRLVYYTDVLYCIFCFIQWILQLQYFCLVLFCVSLSLLNFILFMYYFPDFIELSLSAFCSSFHFLKITILNFYQVNHKSPCLWTWLLEDYCDLFMMSCFLDLSCSLEFSIAVFWIWNRSHLF